MLEAIKNSFILDSDFIIQIFIRLFVNILAIGVLIRFIYYPINKKKEYLFVFVMFNILIFFIASFLSSVKMETGFAFGLFAIFSIIRYRTKQIPIKEMTFLFISIILATINSTVTSKIGIIMVVLADVIILLCCFLMEQIWQRNDFSITGKRGNRKKKLRSIKITYDQLNRVNPHQPDAMKENLEKALGFTVLSFEIISIDISGGSSEIKVYY